MGLGQGNVEVVSAKTLEQSSDDADGVGVAAVKVDHVVESTRPRAPNHGSPVDEFDEPTTLARHCSLLG